MTEQQPNNNEKPRVELEGSARAAENTPPPKESFFDKFMDKFVKGLKKIDRKVKAAFRRIAGVGSPRRGPDAGSTPPNLPTPPEGERTDPIAAAIRRAVRPMSILAAKGILALSVLTGFAEKKTDTPTATDKEPPKATLNVGTLGVTVAKVKINNGNKATDFDANMPLAKAAREVVGSVLPQSEQDKLFMENPIGNGAIEDIRETINGSLNKLPAALVKKTTGKKDNKTLLQEGADGRTAAPKTTATKVPDKVLADKLGKDI